MGRETWTHEELGKEAQAKTTVSSTRRLESLTRILGWIETHDDVEEETKRSTLGRLRLDGRMVDQRRWTSGASKEQQTLPGMRQANVMIMATI